MIRGTKYSGGGGVLKVNKGSLVVIKGVSPDVTSQTMEPVLFAHKGWK
jgi:hypothetical protein